MEQSTLSDSTRMPAAQVETRDPEQEARVAGMLAATGIEPGPDGALPALGRELDAAIAAEREACALADAAVREAGLRKPDRPACLVFTEDDVPLKLRQRYEHPAALVGSPVQAADVDWMRRRMPMQHEVLRPICEGERAHIDHPGRKFEIVPHPEAQARAEEIIAAWEAWNATIERINAECGVPEAEAVAENAGEAASALAFRIAELPARTAEGLRVKLRALIHYNPRALPIDAPDEPDPDQVLARSIRLDLTRTEPADHSVQALPAVRGCSAAGIAEPDAALIDLGRQWERAAAFYAAKHAEMVALSDAVEGTGPGPAPRGAGPAYQEWQNAVDEWRDRTGVGQAEEASGDALTELGEVEDLIATAKATTPEGLRVKARVGQRCQDTEIEWPDGLAAGLVADLLASAPLAISGAALSADRDAAEPDPIFAALDACRAPEAEREAFHAVHSAGRTGPGYTAEREMALDRAEEAAWDAVFATVPTTQNGRLALVQFAERLIKQSAPADGASQDGDDTVFAQAYRSLARAVRAEQAEPIDESLDKAFYRAADLKALDIKDLSHLAFWTESLMTMASGLSYRGGTRPLGRFFDHITFALSDVIGRAQDELRTRTPSDALEREYRTKTIALPVIENGDADELESLIADLQTEVAYLRQPMTTGVAR